jgi:predicted nucleic acid-binding protein
MIDERLGRNKARERGIPVIGPLGILDDAASQGWIDLIEALTKLQQTNFRVSPQIIQQLLDQPRN